MKFSFFAYGLLLSSIFSNQVLAGPADYIYTPTVEFGERELEIKFGRAAPVGGVTGRASSVGYGFSSRENWFTEISLKQKENGNKSTTLAEWENRFQLTETGQYPIDFGVVTELEIPIGGTAAPKEIKVGGLFQTEIGRLQLNGNVLFKRDFGLAGGSFNTSLNYQWQTKYRWKPELEFGVQSFGGMGKWNDWSQQSKQANSVGPAIFGRLKLGDRRIKYNAAWLIHTNSNTPDHTFRTQLEYEF